MGTKGPVPFITIDLAGGANLMGSEAIAGMAGSPTNFISTAGFSKLGVPGNMVPTSTAFIDMSMGLPFHSDSAILRGIKSKASADDPGQGERRGHPGHLAERHEQQHAERDAPHRQGGSGLPRGQWLARSVRYSTRRWWARMPRLQAATRPLRRLWIRHCNRPVSPAPRITPPWLVRAAGAASTVTTRSWSLRLASARVHTRIAGARSDKVPTPAACVFRQTLVSTISTSIPGTDSSRGGGCGPGTQGAVAVRLREDRVHGSNFAGPGFGQS